MKNLQWNTPEKLRAFTMRITAKSVVDFHHQVVAHAGRTKKSGIHTIKLFGHHPITVAI